MYANTASSSVDNLRSYELAGRGGVTSAATDQRYPPVRVRLMAFREFDYATTKPVSLEITVDDVTIDRGVVLRRRETLVLRASLREPDDCYRAEVPGIGLPIAAYTRGELIDAVRDLIAVSWKEYALEDDANLTSRGKRLKAHLLREYREVGRCS